jgi:hypothetical protein
VTSRDPVERFARAGRADPPHFFGEITGPRTRQCLSFRSSAKRRKVTTRLPHTPIRTGHPLASIHTHRVAPFYPRVKFPKEIVPCEYVLREGRGLQGGLGILWLKHGRSGGPEGAHRAGPDPGFGGMVASGRGPNPRMTTCQSSAIL